MHVSPLVWLVTIVVLVGLLAVDVFVVGRRPHTPTPRECVVAVAGFVALAVLFGIGILHFSGPDYAGQFFAGWITEYSLSVDNLFVFLIVIAGFGVPRHLQQTALLAGIVLALVFRGVFIGLGAALIAQFAWIFYIFGAFLVYTAVQLIRHRNREPGGYHDNAVLRFARRHLPIAAEYDGVRLTTRRGGRRFVTPLLLVIVALGTTDLLFALDSIPAIFGLTSEPYLVFTANVFALMGLRQLYFLLGGLLDRLVYLSIGLAVVLAFIGAKLVLHALHENNLPFVNDGQPVPGVPEVGTLLSLGFVVVVIVLTTAASLLRYRGSGPLGGRPGGVAVSGHPAGGPARAVGEDRAARPGPTAGG